MRRSPSRELQQKRPLTTCRWSAALPTLLDWEKIAANPDELVVYTIALEAIVVIREPGSQQGRGPREQRSPEGREGSWRRGKGGSDRGGGTWEKQPRTRTRL